MTTYGYPPYLWRKEKDMVELDIRADCGNSPRREFLKDFNSAFANGDVPYITAHLTDDIVWDMVGDKKISGKTDMLKELALMQDSPVKKMVLHTVVTHGREASANGEMHMASGDVYAFCDVYTFAKTTGTAIKAITSYVIQL
ncbi:nuclear transport factor 2 family protein [Parapedobacter deserti]|uniref:Nuclear transport factor 2 family protein n=1 Tax=Parapedobacter deserti TaxID=1912957 RepID=A0ABV7JT39_9SPHI